MSCDICHTDFVGQPAVKLAQDQMQQAEHLDEEDPQRSRAMMNLANALLREGRNAEAADLYKANLAAIERRDGERHADFLSVLTSLGRALNDVSQLRRAFDLSQSSLGKRHSITLTAGNNLALALFDNGKQEDAIDLFERTLAGRRSTLGEKHKQTLESLNNLAGALSRCGKRESVVGLLKDVLSHLRRALGDERVDTLRVAQNLAVALSAVARYSEAIVLQRQTLEAQKRTLGEHHAKTLESQRFLALLEQGVSKQQEGITDARSSTTDARSSHAEVVAPMVGTKRTASELGRDCSGHSKKHSPHSVSGCFDMVLALLLQAGLQFEEAGTCASAFLADGFDCVPALRNLTEADMLRLGLKERSHRQSLLEILAEYSGQE